MREPNTYKKILVTVEGSLYCGHSMPDCVRSIGIGVRTGWSYKLCSHVIRTYHFEVFNLETVEKQ